MSVKLDNLVDEDTCQILCESCQELIHEGFDSLRLHSDCLYHEKCWLRKVNNWHEQQTQVTEGTLRGNEA